MLGLAFLHFASSPLLSRLHKDDDVSVLQVLVQGYYVVDAETYQEVTADDEGSVYGDDEEEGNVVDA